MKAIKDAKNLFFFDDLQNLKIVDVSTVTLRKFKKKISIGDAYWLSGNEISKIKTIKRKER
jgi:S-DNA-T family DNA segregation ATPase FtsK/SpoIIIE